MADVKISDLTPTTAPGADALVEVTTDPGGTPATESAELRYIVGQYTAVNVQSGSTYTLAATDIGGLVICTDASCDVTVPDDGDVTWPVKAFTTILFAGGAGTLVEDTSVTVNVSAGQSLVAEDAGSFVQLVKTAAETWWAAGRLAQP